MTILLTGRLLSHRWSGLVTCSTRGRIQPAHGSVIQELKEHSVELLGMADVSGRAGRPRRRAARYCDHRLVGTRTRPLKRRDTSSESPWITRVGTVILARSSRKSVVPNACQAAEHRVLVALPAHCECLLSLFLADLEVVASA